jgi:hypothetical protein
MVEIDWDMVKKLYETGSTDHSIGKKFEFSFKKYTIEDIKIDYLLNI